MLRIGKGNGQILLSCQSDRKQAKHLILYKRLYKRQFLYNQFTSNLQKKFCKSYWQTAGKVYNWYRWERNGTHCREGKAQRKRNSRKAGRSRRQNALWKLYNIRENVGYYARWKARRKCKATNRNKHRTFTLALQRLSHSAKAKTRAFRARNDENRKEGINNES